MSRKARKKTRRVKEGAAVAFEPESPAPEDGAGEDDVWDGGENEASVGGGKQKSGAGIAKKGTSNGGISTYVFTFELIKQYPTVRSFIVKQPLKRSFGDSLSDLFGGSKKGIYKL